MWHSISKTYQIKIEWSISNFCDFLWITKWNNPSELLDLIGSQGSESPSNGRGVTESLPSSLLPWCSFSWETSRGKPCWKIGEVGCRLPRICVVSDSCPIECMEGSVLMLDRKSVLKYRFLSHWSLHTHKKCIWTPQLTKALYTPQLNPSLVLLCQGAQHQTPCH